MSMHRAACLRRFASNAWHPSVEQRFQKGDRAASCAQLAPHELLSTGPKSCHERWIFEAATNERFELIGVLHDNSGIARSKRCNDVAEIPCIRSEGDRSAVSG